MAYINSLGLNEAHKEEVSLNESSFVFSSTSCSSSADVGSTAKNISSLPQQLNEPEQIDLQALQFFLNNMVLAAKGSVLASNADDVKEMEDQKQGSEKTNTQQNGKNIKKSEDLNEKVANEKNTVYGPVKHKELREINAHVTVEQFDSSYPLPHVKDWKDLRLNEDLLRGIYTKGFNKPSKIQQAALPLIVGTDANLIGQAQSGSGKTAAFVLAMLSKVDSFLPYPQAMCLCPTRELATQNLEVMKELGRYTPISYFLAVPLCPKYYSELAAQIFVGTPGKTMEILKKKLMKTQYMRMFVLDEADEMIDHRNNMSPQVQQIRRFFAQSLQVLLFSATYSDEVREFANKIVPKANKIIVNKEDLTLECISQFYIECFDDQQKFLVLSDLYGSLTVGQSIIFVNSRKTAFELTIKMQKEGHAVSLICGTQASGKESIDHETRDIIMKEFRFGQTKVLICTDVLARGIDVPQVTLVINYDLPILFRRRESDISNSKVNMETYIHRIGRTGRFGLRGIAINLVTLYERQMLEEIRSFYQCSISQLSSDVEEIETMVQKLRM